MSCYVLILAREQEVRLSQKADLKTNSQRPKGQPATIADLAMMEFATEAPLK
ncbi:hypothetical protein ACVME8_009717 [Bradyrhizobium diazoefficiens]